MENKQQDNSADSMKTLTECLNKAAEIGHTTNFSIKSKQLYDAMTDRYFAAEDTHVINYYRFEGSSDPDDMDILYLITTNDGIKGVLTDAYGTYANAHVNEFILRVQDIHKKDAGQ